MYKLLGGILSLMFIFIIITLIVNYKVCIMENNIKKLNYQIIDNYKSLQSLKAEWNYLNNPKYLRIMLKEHLTDMVPICNPDNDKVLKIPLKPKYEIN